MSASSEHKQHTKLFFNDRWLALVRANAIRLYPLYEYHAQALTVKPWRSWRQLWRPNIIAAAGVHDDSLWVVECNRAQTLFKRFTLTDEAHLGAVFFGAQAARTALSHDIYLYPLSKHYVLIHENEFPERYLIQERPYQNDAIVIMLPHLANYAIVNADGLPVPVLRQAHRVAVLTPRMEIERILEHNAPIRDVAVDPWCKQIYCLLPQELIAYDLTTYRIVFRHTLRERYGRITARQGYVAMMHDQQSLCVVLTHHGTPVDRLPGRLVLCNSGVAIHQGRHALVFTPQGSQMVYDLSSNTAGIFSTPTHWLIVEP